MELYHIHSSNKYDDNFKEGNVIHFGDKPNMMRSKALERHGCLLEQVIPDSNGKNHYIYRDLEDYIDPEQLATMEKEQAIRLLKELYVYVHNSKIDMREIIMEEVRYHLCPKNPSRYSCAWLTDEESLPYWLEQLNAANRAYSLYEVDAEGNLFVSTDKLLPNGCYSRGDIYNASIKYWNPTEEDLKEPCREYLFEGDLKLTKRIK